MPAHLHAVARIAGVVAVVMCAASAASAQVERAAFDGQREKAAAALELEIAQADIDLPRPDGARAAEASSEAPQSPVAEPASSPFANSGTGDAQLGTAAPVGDQLAAPPPAARTRPPTLKLLLGTQAALHGVDMFTTAYALHLGERVREGNPLLAPFAQRPMALAVVSTAVDVLQMYTISRLDRHHPKLAVVWALVLIGTETFAVANNVKVAGQIRRARGY